MHIQTHRRLEMIRADVEGWEDSVRRHIDDGSNFVLILPKDKKAIEEFCELFGLPRNCQPKELTRPGFFRLSQFMEGEAFDSVLANWHSDKQVVFVEQLDFPVNRPPRLQTFLVYSPVLGIIAQAPNMAGAKEALADYEQHWGSPQPEASIYLWQKNRWNLYEGR
jgi:hypothetical protein